MVTILTKEAEMTAAERAAAEPDRLPEPLTPAPDPCEEATAQVRLDALDDPETYLADTIVPGGGE
jgi:hypothetical protein